MSAIASFYLAQNSDVDRLKDLATQPVGLVERGRWRDPYSEFLRANARTQEQFDWSGDVMLTVSAFLESRNVKLAEYCDKALSDFLVNARKSSISVFRAAPGKALAQLIGANQPDEETLEAFLASSDGEDMPVEAVLDGLRILKTWLTQIDNDHIGLLTLG